MTTYAWQPHPGPQWEFCSRGEFEVLFGGAAGPGKTSCLIIEATRYVYNANYKGIILRRTFPQLQEIIDRCHTWYPQIDPGAQYRATEHRWHFSSGATIALGHMQHEADMYNYQGKEYHFVGFDELTQFTAQQYLYLFSRCRSVDPTLPSRIRSTTNPGGIGHSWVKERFVDMALPGATYIDPTNGLSRAFVPATIFDNPTLVQNDPGYLQRLQALPEVERMRLLEGSWDVFAGQVFRELSHRVHGCDPFEIPAEWEKWCAFDWGFAKPWACIWLAQDYDGVIYIYRELYGAKRGEAGAWLGPRQTNTEISRAIRDAEREKLRFRVADPACWGPTKLHGRNDMLGPSFVEDAGKEGLFFLKADNDRIRGKSQIHQRLMVEEDLDEATGEVLRQYPRLVVFNNLDHWWRTMQLMQENESNPEDVDTDLEDHLYDCLAAGTPVITPQGEVPIAELVGKSGEVLTVGNRWTRFTNCQRYRRNCDMVRVSLDNGRSIICTPDHRFLTIDGKWVQAKCLTDSNGYVIISQPIGGDIICGPSLSTKAHRSSPASGTTYAENIFSAAASDSTGLSGNSIAERSPKGVPCITLTMTLQTIKSRICDWLGGGSIKHITHFLGTIPIGLIPCVAGPQGGTGVPRGGNGTACIMSGTARTKCMSRLPSSATNAGLSLWGENIPVSVQMLASQLGAELTGWMTRQEYALFAGSCSAPIVSPASELVQELARESCKAKQSGRVIRIEDAPPADSYCLEADHTHAFAVSGGVVVSNCTRYGLMARPMLPKRKSVVAPGSFRSERDKLIRAKAYAKRHGVSLQAAYARGKA